MICPNPECREYTSARYVRCPHCGQKLKPPEEPPKPLGPMPGLPVTPPM